MGALQGVRSARLATFSIVSINNGKEVTMASPAPVDIARIVTFFFLADESGNPRVNTETGGHIANATGFFVVVENENGHGGHVYLVTAKHVLHDQNGGLYSRVFIRVNTKEKKADYLALDLIAKDAGQNIFIHADPTVDIAVIVAMPPRDRFDFLAIPAAMIKSKDDFKKTTIAPGSDVFFTGLFVPHLGEKLNSPIFRFGRVAMLPEEKIRWQDSSKPAEQVELYLLETMSFGGNSGSPVFFSQGADREPGSIIVGPPEITLAGVMRGNFNEPRVGGFVQTPNALVPAFAQNVGIAAVTPGHLLRDILFSVALQRQRAENPVKSP
jgi:hypothetical protein